MVRLLFHNLLERVYVRERAGEVWGVRLKLDVKSQGGKQLEVDGQRVGVYEK